MCPSIGLLYYWLQSNYSFFWFKKHYESNCSFSTCLFTIILQQYTDVELIWLARWREREQNYRNLKRFFHLSVRKKGKCSQWISHVQCGTRWPLLTKLIYRVKNYRNFLVRFEHQILPTQLKFTNVYQWCDIKGWNYFLVVKVDFLAHWVKQHLIILM